MVSCRLSLAAFLSIGTPLAAQEHGGLLSRTDFVVGGELESYTRYLQSLGLVRPYPWSIRGFSPREIDHLSARAAGHPWAAHFNFTADSSKRRLELLRPGTSIRWNSRFPYGENDGAIWAGRGLTTALEAGFAARFGAASVTVSPIIFRAENREFPLISHGNLSESIYSDPRMPELIDQPQRFGDEPYVRLDPGQSSLRFDGGGVAAGISTANQAWGPAHHYPFILSANAPGYPHAFLGTGRPIGLGLFSLHTRMVWGVLEESDYTSITGDDSRRFMSGIVGTLQIRGIDGLEIGGARFFHIPWPAGGPRGRHFLRPIEGLLKRRLPRDSPGTIDELSVANQLGSVFARWVLPNSGFELFTEFGREDHSWDTRDLLVQPDHSRTFGFGFRKAWLRNEGHLLALHAELISSRPVTFIEKRPGSGATYGHAQVRQGHTHLGQVLGSPAAARTGSGARLAVESYHHKGRWTASWTRTLRGDRSAYGLSLDLDPASADVVHTIGLESVRFIGFVDLTAGLTGVLNMNRFQQGDLFNLNALVTGRWRLP